MNQFTSGDVLADRRADYARMLAEGGEVTGAAELMVQALEIAPGWAAGWFRLAEYEEKSGRKEAAVTALAKVRALDPDDLFGAGLKLAVLGAVEQPRVPPSRYVERLFDDYAGRFDEALVGRLEYSVPEKLSALVRSKMPRGRRFACVTDLGCGTGLFGEHIRPHADLLEGFDLSVNMLAKARDKTIYDRLHQADLSLEPDASGIFSDDSVRGRADLVAAADVLMYLGDLERVFAIASILASHGGLFAFSVEDAAPDTGFLLRQSLRYAHSEAYVRALCARHGFAILACERTRIRIDAGMPITGILFVAHKGA